MFHRVQVEVQVEVQVQVQVEVQVEVQVAAYAAPTTLFQSFVGQCAQLRRPKPSYAIGFGRAKKVKGKSRRSKSPIKSAVPVVPT
jgi:hypothetical protein